MPFARFCSLVAGLALMLAAGCTGCGEEETPCADGQLACADSCVDPAKDHLNCGACGTVCADGERCQGGACVLTCVTGYGACPADAPTYCADLTVDADDCGSCGNACAAGEQCENGDCVTDCTSGYTACPVTDPTYCADLDVDSNNCGGCGLPCPAGQQCAGGNCACPAAAPDLCGAGVTAFCTTFATDPQHCGNCSTVCAAGEKCQAGDCVTSCATDYSACPVADPSYCADLDVDSNNCGSCGRGCAAGEKCDAGDCVPDCAIGHTACPTVDPTYCADLLGDASNCGGCGDPCAAGQLCLDGICGCPTAQPDLCGSGSDAYCTSLQHDVGNCGGCGHPCGLGEVCCSGGCCSNLVARVTVLHTNDFHGNLQLAGSSPGIARVASVVDGVRTSVGMANVALLDAGDMMQGTLLSNLFHGESTIDLYNDLGYAAATLGNHEFDWGQAVLDERATQASFPFLAANVVVNDTGDCETAGWTAPIFARPWLALDVGDTSNRVRLGVIGVTSQETPNITIASATQGLCFKDPAQAIGHYYQDLRAAGVDAVIVLSHLGNSDGGYGYGLLVYGDQTLARTLVANGTPADLIIGGHSHTDLAAAQVVDGTTVVQAHYAGRKVGRADLVVNRITGQVTVAWQRLTVSATGAEDPTIRAAVDTWATDPWYLGEINRVVGYTNVDLLRDYNGDSLMGRFIADAVFNDLNSDATADNDVDMVLTNAGGLRSDFVTGGVTPATLTHGHLYNVLPFGNVTVVGEMTGAEIAMLLDQSATLFKGALQVSGVRYRFYRYSDALPGPQPWAWGAYDITVWNPATSSYQPLALDRSYRIATNEFLAPAGQDGFAPFKYIRNLTYWGDMLENVERWVARSYPITAPYAGTVDGRIAREGTDSAGAVVPVTLLHHGDSHGRLAKVGSSASFTQLATLVQQERAHNPTRTLLLHAGDAVQGDAMMYYFWNAAGGLTADGATLDAALRTHPAMAALNALDYDAYVLGEHDFDFGSRAFRDVATGTTSGALFRQAAFPLLMANATDDGSFGLADSDVAPHALVEVPGPSGNIKVAILGLGSAYLARSHLPGQLAGLTIGDPIAAAQAQAPALRAGNHVLVALSHLGFGNRTGSVEPESMTDLALAAQVSGLDAIVGGRSHIDPGRQNAEWEGVRIYPHLVRGAGDAPVLVAQAYRYNVVLGEVVLGLLPTSGGGYRVVSRTGRTIAVSSGVVEEIAIKAIVDPYTALLDTWQTSVVGQTEVPIGLGDEYGDESVSLNLQTDAARWALQHQGVDVDCHLGGVGSTALVASAATALIPVNLTESDLFALAPGEESLVVLSMNGPQLKAVLERAYRNYYYLRYVPDAGGYQLSASCLLGIDAGSHITFDDSYPALPDGNNVVSFDIGGAVVDFADASTFYNVSTLSALAAGACYYSDADVSLWPLGQIVDDTGIRARQALGDYIAGQSQPITPMTTGRLVYQ